LQQGTNGVVTILGPVGSIRVFQSDARGGYFAQPGDYGTLAPTGTGAYTLTEKTGLLYFYNANGQLSYVQDLNNNTVTLGYTGPLLTSLTHSSGQYIQMAYNAAGLIQTVIDNFGHQTILNYDAANQHLLGAQFFDGRTANYTYNTIGSPGRLLENTHRVSSLLQL
jgi:YD repeat-containing protein